MRWDLERDVALRGNDLHQVEVHEARMQGAGCRDVAVFLFLLFGAEHEAEAVVKIVVERRGFVVGVNDKVPASSLVGRFDKPFLDVAHQFRANVFALVVDINAKPSDKDCGIDHVAFGGRDVLADLFSARIRQMVCENAGVGHGEGADDVVCQAGFNKGIGFAEKLIVVGGVIAAEEIVQVGISATERCASFDDVLRQNHADAAVFQKGHLPDAFSEAMRCSFTRSKSFQIACCAEKSMQPRFRSASSAARTNRSATSPDKTGILLIANAILFKPFGVDYSKFFEIGSMGRIAA